MPAASFPRERLGVAGASVRLRDPRQGFKLKSPGRPSAEAGRPSESESRANPPTPGRALGPGRVSRADLDETPRGPASDGFVVADLTLPLSYCGLP